MYLIPFENYNYEIFVLRKILPHPICKASLIPLTTSRLRGGDRSSGSSALYKVTNYQNLTKQMTGKGEKQTIVKIHLTVLEFLCKHILDIFGAYSLLYQNSIFI